MRCGRRVTRLLAGVGILTIGFASVAQAAGVDRKAYRAARESRVATAANARENPRSDLVALSFSQRSHVTRLLAAASSSLARENRILGSENKLIGQQNRIVRQLNSATRPVMIPFTPPINDGLRMANSTLMAILGRMCTYTGQEIKVENEELIVLAERDLLCKVEV